MKGQRLHLESEGLQQHHERMDPSFLLLAVQADDSHGAEVWATLYPSLNKKMNSLHSDCLSSDFLRGAQFFFVCVGLSGRP